MAGAALAVVVAAGLWVWLSWVPGYRPLRDGERFGIDVSHHQGAIDWSRVAADGVGFAYVKATEGGDWVDPRFARNWAEAGEAGIDRGAYHFFTLCRPGAEQAENLLRTVPIEEAALPAAIDLELAGNCADRPDVATVDREVRAFLERVEDATGEPVVLYVGDDFEARYGLRDSLDRPVWHRRILLRPDVDGWWIWQIHGYGRIDGIEGAVDVNVMRPLPAAATQGDA